MPSVFERAFFGSGVLFALALSNGAARADDLPDPTYGRIDGDVTFVAGVGGVVSARGLHPAAELRVRYLESAGLFASYEDGSLVSSGSEPSRLATGGLELRPFFLFRWLRGLELHRARIDLAVDSIGIELGATLQSSSAKPAVSGPGLQAGLGAEFPVWEASTGPWLGVHGGLRWSVDALSGYAALLAPQSPAAFLTITLAWHEVFAAHLVDIGDRALR